MRTAISFSYRPRLHGVRVSTNTGTNIATTPEFIASFTMQLFYATKLEIQPEYENTNFAFLKTHKSVHFYFILFGLITFEIVRDSGLFLFVCLFPSLSF